MVLFHTRHNGDLHRRISRPVSYTHLFGSSIPSTILFKVVLDGEEIQVTEIPCTSSGGYTRLK